MLASRFNCSSRLRANGIRSLGKQATVQTLRDSFTCWMCVNVPRCPCIHLLCCWHLLALVLVVWNILSHSPYRASSRPRHNHFRFSYMALDVVASFRCGIVNQCRSYLSTDITFSFAWNESRERKKASTHTSLRGVSLIVVDNNCFIRCLVFLHFGQHVLLSFASCFVFI